MKHGQNENVIAIFFMIYFVWFDFMDISTGLDSIFLNGTTLSTLTVAFTSRPDLYDGA